VPVLLHYYRNLVKDRLNLYIQSIDRMRLISLDELQQLFIQANQMYDGEVEQALINASLRYVVNIARDYLKYDLPFDDLIQEGNIGLIKALRQFKPESGPKFGSFVIRSINLEICRFVLNNWCIVTAGVTKEQLHLFMRMRRFKPSRAALSASEAMTVAANLGIQLFEVLHLEKRLRAQVISFDEEEQTPGEASRYNYDVIDNNDQIEEIEELDWNTRRMSFLNTALASLDERAREVIKRRWLVSGKKAGFREISNIYHLSGERIRQIQGRAFGTIRRMDLLSEKTTNLVVRMTCR